VRNPERQQAHGGLCPDPPVAGPGEIGLDPALCHAPTMIIVTQLLQGLSCRL
jgi:hypothetical protein